MLPLAKRLSINSLCFLWLSGPLHKPPEGGEADVATPEADKPGAQPRRYLAHKLRGKGKAQDVKSPNGTLQRESQSVD